MRRSERQNYSASVLEPSSQAPSLSPIDAPSLHTVDRGEPVIALSETTG